VVTCVCPHFRSNSAIPLLKTVVLQKNIWFINSWILMVLKITPFKTITCYIFVSLTNPVIYWLALTKKILKFCNQLITNPMEVTMVLYFYCKVFLIYVFMYMSKIASIINWILGKLPFWSTLPCFCLGMSATNFFFFQKSIPIEVFWQPHLAYFRCSELVIRGLRNWTLDGSFFALIKFFLVKLL
jgi:hypothetical protein